MKTFKSFLEMKVPDNRIQLILDQTKDVVTADIKNTLSDLDHEIYRKVYPLLQQKRVTEEQIEKYAIWRYKKHLGMQG